MCLAENCPEKLLCESCVPNHNGAHKSSLHNITEYLDTLHRSSRNKSNDDLFAQVKCFLEKQEETIESISQVHEDKERDVLSIFDQLKCEINDTLDIAYQKYCNSLRTYHHKKVQDVQRKMHILNNMVRMQTSIQERSFPPNLKENELHDLVKQFSKFSTHCNSLPIDLAERFKQLSDLVNDKSQLSLNLDRKRCERIRMNILELIREQFDIADEYRQTQSKDSYNSDSPKENNSHSPQDAGICALVTLKDNFIATAGRDAKIKLWNLSTGDCAGELSGHHDTIWDIRAAFEGKYLISSSADATIKVWRVSEKKLKKTFKGHECPVYALEFEESTKTLISGGQNGTLFLWDMNEGKIAKKLVGHKKAIWTIKKLAGDKIVTGGEDREIKIWSIKTSGLIKSLSGHENCIYDISVFREGKRLASCDDDGMIILWDVEKGVAVEKLQAHEKGIRSLAVNEKGTLLASGGYDRVFRLWDLEKLCLLRENSANDAIIRCIRFLSDNGLLYCDTNVKNYKFSK